MHHIQVASPMRQSHHDNRQQPHAHVPLTHTHYTLSSTAHTHTHLSVRLRLVLQILHNALDDVSATDFLRQLHRGLHQLLVVPPVQSHAANPEIPEELGHNLVAHILRLDALCGDALLDDFQHDLLHFFVGRGKLSDEDEHDLFGVVAGMRGVHERDDEADGWGKKGRERKNMNRMVRKRAGL